LGGFGLFGAVAGLAAAGLKFKSAQTSMILADSRSSLDKGDAVMGKIGGLKIYAQPSKSSKVLASLAKGEEVIFTGQEKNGFMSIQGNDGEGWVEKIMIKKQDHYKSFTRNDRSVDLRTMAW
jgi:hypothetical protein